MDLKAITAVAVKGFKSFAEEQRLEIRPLTLLAGVNSSGKSSALQPLLLLKQTLENSFDPGALLLDGPHVRFTSASQMLAHRGGQRVAEELEFTLEIFGSLAVKDTFRRRLDEKFDLVRMSMALPNKVLLEFWPGMPEEEILRQWSSLRGPFPLGNKAPLHVVANRCFLGVAEEGFPGNATSIAIFHDLALRSVIHVPGLRGNPAREYRTTDVPEFFQGTFENYASSIVSLWQREKDFRLNRLGKALERLGLTGKIRAKSVDATRVELLVGRLPRQKKDTDDLVSIADVGFGVSQVLPVLVALLAAEPDQLVYLEQPELHLHPRAQQALASILADAARRGVRVVAETHSSILLLAVQALVAEGKLAPDLVKLHWFTRDANGATKVTSADLDRLGAYGDWPEDFAEVQADADNRYLDAVESAVRKPSKNARKKTARR